MGMLSWAEEREMLLNTQERVPWESKQTSLYFRGFARSNGGWSHRRH